MLKTLSYNRIQIQKRGTPAHEVVFLFVQVGFTIFLIIILLSHQGSRVMVSSDASLIARVQQALASKDIISSEHFALLASPAQENAAAVSKVSDVAQLKLQTLTSANFSLASVQAALEQAFNLGTFHIPSVLPVYTASIFFALTLSIIYALRFTFSSITTDLLAVQKTRAPNLFV